jgi:hypothetical protein
VTARAGVSPRFARAEPGNSQDARIWELRIGPVPADQVARIIEEQIW